MGQELPPGRAVRVGGDDVSEAAGLSEGRRRPCPPSRSGEGSRLVQPPPQACRHTPLLISECGKPPGGTDHSPLGL